MITPSMTLAFREAIDGSKGDLDAWLEVNSEAEVREHIKALIESETKELMEALETCRVELPGTRLQKMSFDEGKVTAVLAKHRKPV